MKATTTILCASLAILAAAPSFAQEAYGFGLSASHCSPIGDLGGIHGNGFGLAGFAERRFTRLMAGRLRVEYMGLGDKEMLYQEPLITYHEPYNYDWPYNSVKMLFSTTKLYGAVADFVLGKDKGLYGFVGVGYIRVDFGVSVFRDVQGIDPRSWIVQGIDPRSWIVSDGDYDLSRNGFATSIGLGYNFTKHFGAEVKSTDAFSKSFAQVSLLYRF
jgi:hypothetical protein